MKFLDFVNAQFWLIKMKNLKDFDYFVKFDCFEFVGIVLKDSPVNISLLKCTFDSKNSLLFNFNFTNKRKRGFDDVFLVDFTDLTDDFIEEIEGGLKFKMKNIDFIIKNKEEADENTDVANVNDNNNKIPKNATNIDNTNNNINNNIINKNNTKSNNKKTRKNKSLLLEINNWLSSYNSDSTDLINRIDNSIVEFITLEEIIKNYKNSSVEINQLKLVKNINKSVNIWKD